MLSTHGRVIVVLTAFAAFALSGCACGGRSIEVTDMQTDSFSFPVDSAERTHVELELGIGELTVTGGGRSNCAGEFQYNVAEWKPVVEQETRAGELRIRVTQPGTEGCSIKNDARSNWTIELPDDTPAQLVIDIGVGESRLNLSDARVERVDLDAGVGEITIDASRVAHNLVINVDSGVGEVHIQVPEDIGVEVDCDRGIGSFTHSGFKRSHGGYVNAAYGTTDSVITVRVNTGVGSVNILTGTMTASI